MTDNPAANCTDCRLGTIEVSCPRRAKDGSVCRLCKGTGRRLHRRQVVWGDGTVPCKIMFIGEAPGYQEDLMGQPFYPEAPAGRVLRRTIADAGLPANQVYITNLVRCRPPDNKLSAYPDAIVACSRWLDEEIRRATPSVIVALGALPAERYFGKRPAREVAGLARAMPDGTVVVGAYHPAYVARGVDEEAGPSLRRSVERAKRMSRA